MLRKRPLVILAVLAVSAAFFACVIFGIGDGYEKIAADTKCTVEGRISWMEEKEYRCDIRLSRVKITDDDGNVFRYKKVMLVVKNEKEKWLDLKIGCYVEADCICVHFEGAPNDGNFDEKKYYNSLGLKEKFEYISGLKQKGRGYDLIKHALYRLRLKIINIFKDAQPGDTGGYLAVLSSLVTGDRNGIDPDIKELYQDTGIAHILAISGLHISLIGLGAFSFLRKRAGVTAACIASSVIMIAYCILTGAGISALRAGGMFILRIIAYRTGRKFDIFRALSLMAILLIADEPAVIYNSGFLLSFGAVLGIALCIEPVKQFLCIEEENRVGTAFAASLSASLFTLPIVAATFYQVPLLSVLINMAVIPLMSIVLGSALAASFAGFISAAFTRLAAGAGVISLSLIEALCALMNAIPFAAVITGNISIFKAGLYYAILLALIFAAKKAKTVYGKERLKRVGMVLASGIVLLMVLSFRIPDAEMKIMFLDVGQGDGIVIRSDQGTTFMIDGGSSSIDELYRYRVEDALKYNAIKSIDYCIISHTDMDHMSAVVDMLDEKGAGRIKIKNILVPEIKESENFEMLISKAKERGVNIRYLSQGVTIEDGDLRLKCLYPEEGFKSEDVNAYSAVIELEYKGYKALFTGDLGEEGERLLLKEDLLSDGYDLLKVAHHGSKTSSSEKFIEKISPETAVVSAGKNNIYNHPAPEVEERIEESGADLFVTARCGQVSVLVKRGGQVKIESKKPGR